MKYIVTGAAGLIGSALIWKLNQLGIDDILAVDHLGTSEKWKNLRALAYADYMEKDVFMERLTNGALPRDTEVILHMGACSSTTEKDATYLIGNNFDYTRKLALFAATRGIQFLYASSAATYGAGEHGYADDESRIDELRPVGLHILHERNGLFIARQNDLTRVSSRRNVWRRFEHALGDFVVEHRLAIDNARLEVAYKLHVGAVRVPLPELEAIAPRSRMESPDAAEQHEIEPRIHLGIDRSAMNVNAIKRKRL